MILHWPYDPDKQPCQYKVIWGNCEGRWRDQLEHSVSPSLPAVRGPFSHRSLGSRPTKQLASMGIPACSHADPSISALSLFLSRSLAAGPRRVMAKFIFSTVVPLRWRRGPCHAAADVLGEGPQRDVRGTLLLLQHSILLFLLKDWWWCPVCTGQRERVSVTKGSHVPPAKVPDKCF